MWQLYPIQRPVQLIGLYTAFEQQFPADYIFRGETHDFYELVLVLNGSLGVTAGAQPILLEAPAAILHPPMQFHSLRAAQGSCPHVIVFSFSVHSFPAFEKYIFAIDDHQIARAKQVLALLQKDKGRLFPGSPIQGEERNVQQALLELEILLLTLSGSGDAFSQKESSAGARNYRFAVQVIEENLSAPLDTPTLAHLTHMSPSLLKKTFSRHAGVGVMEYVRTRKIHAAIPLLREGLSVQEIATRLGFSNAGYFSTVFHRITGHTPGYYRNH